MTKRICIYAFSSTAYFFRALIELCRERSDDVEWSVVLPQGHFRHVFDGLIPPERVGYLYEGFAAAYAACGPAEIQRAMQTGDGLHVALLRDKAGYRFLDKDEQLRRGAAMDVVYRAFLARVRPDFVLTPNIETVDGFVLLNLCRTLNIGCGSYVGTRFLGGGFLSADCYETLPPYFGSYDAKDREAARRALAEFRADQAIGALARYPRVALSKPSWFRRLIVSAWIRRRYELLHATEETLKMRFTRHTQPLVRRVRRARFEILYARFFDIMRGDENLPGRYVLYMLHHTPEASINGRTPYYVDQFRAIEALLLNLPPGSRLVVKEHPSMYGRRPSGFYLALRRLPGVVLAHPAVDSQMLAERADIVATITGTVGLECFLRDKPFLLFGPNFFAHLGHRAPALDDLGPLLRRLAAQSPVTTDEAKEIELAKILNVCGDFIISDPWWVPVVMAPQNIAATRDYLWKHLARIEGRPA